jgi:hypothetical protein
VRLLGASKINVFTTMLEHIQLVIKLARMRISGKVPKIDLVDEDEHRVE